METKLLKAQVSESQLQLLLLFDIRNVVIVPIMLTFFVLIFDLVLYIHISMI